MANHSEAYANHMLEQAAIERARFAAVLGAPSNRAPRKAVKPASRLSGFVAYASVVVAAFACAACHAL